MIEIVETENERSITARELRLRFRRIGDGWTHEIDIGPEPWKLAVEAIEWQSADGFAGGPSYQEIRFERDGDVVLAIASGQAGDHLYSTKFRVSDRTWWADHFQRADIVQERFESRIEVEVNDQCLDQIGPVEARYLVKEPSNCSHLGDSDDRESPDGFSRSWKSSLLWEADVVGNYDLMLDTLDPAHRSRVSITDYAKERGWSVRVSTINISMRGTTRFLYAWDHERVRIWYRTSEGLKPQKRR